MGITTVYYDPSKERPFPRDGNRIFVTSQNEDVPLIVGTNLLQDYVVEELKKDPFFSKLIEMEALIIRESTPTAPVLEELQEVPVAVAAQENPSIPATPVTPNTVTTVPLGGKNVKPLR